MEQNKKLFLDDFSFVIFFNIHIQLIDWILLLIFNEMYEWVNKLSATSSTSFVFLLFSYFQAFNSLSFLSDLSLQTDTRTWDFITIEKISLFTRRKCHNVCMYGSFESRHNQFEVSLKKKKGSSSTNAREEKNKKEREREREPSNR